MNMRVWQISCSAAMAAVVSLAISCGKPPPATLEGNGQANHHNEHAGHDHATHGEHNGPHGGQVIELGRSHEYHAELVDDQQSGTVTIYILDADLQRLAIAAQPVVLNLNTPTGAHSFELVTTDPDAAETGEFISTNPDLISALHAAGTSGKLRVTIGGTPYTGTIESHEHYDHAR